MWRFLINMSIARRLTVAATITALIPGIVISILGSSYVSTLSTVNNTVQADDTAVKLATDMQADLLRMNALLGTFSAAPSSAAANVQNGREIVQLTNDFSVALDAYQRDYQITSSAKMQSIRDALKNDSQGNQEPISQHSMTYVVNLQWKAYEKAQEQTLEDIQKQNDADILAGDIAQANLEYLPLKGNLDNLVEQTESISQIVVQINTFKVYPVFFWTIAAFFFSTLVVFAISYVINLTITRPLRQLVQLTQRIAQGDTNARAQMVGHDETYMVATSMNIMLDSIVSLMKNIQQQHNFLEEHVQKLISEIKGLGTGDLRTRAEVTSDTLGFLAHSFNYIIDELSTLLLPVKMATNEVERAVNRVEMDMVQLAQNAASQKQEMGETLAKIEQINVSADTLFEQIQGLMATGKKMGQECQGVIQSIQQETEGEVEHKKRWMKQVIRLQTAILESNEEQIQGYEATQGNLCAHIHLTQTVVYTLQKALEANRKSSERTDETRQNIEQLTQSVKLLRLLVGTFKL